jgi:hypothetical protein
VTFVSSIIPQMAEAYDLEVSNCIMPQHIAKHQKTAASTAKP